MQHADDPSRYDCSTLTGSGRVSATVPHASRERHRSASQPRQPFRSFAYPLQQCPTVVCRSAPLCNQGNTTSLAPLVRAVTMPTQSVPSRISMRHEFFPCFTNCHIRKWTAAACVPCPAVSYPAPVLTAYSQIAVRSLPATFCDPCTLTGRGLPHYCLRAVLMGA